MCADNAAAKSASIVHGGKMLEIPCNIPATPLSLYLFNSVFYMQGTVQAMLGSS